MKKEWMDTLDSIWKENRNSPGWPLIYELHDAEDREYFMELEESFSGRTNETIRKLTDLYFLVRKNPAWIGELIKKGYSFEAIQYMEKLDDKFMDYQPEQEADQWAKKFEKHLKDDRFAIPQRKNLRKTDNDGLQEWEIEKARQVPLSAVVEGDIKNNRMPCPFHDGDDRNFSINGHYGKCFVCDESSDAIKWLMRIKGMTFKEAVRKLCL